MSFLGVGFGTNVTQTADNAPVFQLDATGLSHSNNFRDFKVVFSATADATKTKRCFIYCPSMTDGGSPPTNLYTDFFLNVVENIKQDGGHYILRSDGPGIWGNRFIRWIAGGDITNGIIYAIPNRSTGQPNNKFDHVYFGATATQSGDGLFVTQAFENCRIDNLELNYGGNVPVINDQSGCSYSIGEFRTELWRYDNGSQSNMFIILADGTLRIERARIFNDIDGADTSVTLFVNGSSLPGSNISVDELVVSCNLTGGATGVFVSDANGPNDRSYNGVRIGAMVGLDASGNHYLTNNTGTAAADFTEVCSFNDDSFMSWLPDADAVLDGTENCVLVVPSWSGSHKIKLPDTFSNLLFTGRRYIIVKTVATTSDLNVYQSDGTTLVGTISLASAGRLEVRYNRSQTNAPSRSWTVTNSTSWTP
jgi:hypothetical protein